MLAASSSTSLPDAGSAEREQRSEAGRQAVLHTRQAVQGPPAPFLGRRMPPLLPPHLPTSGTMLAVGCMHTCHRCELLCEAVCDPALQPARAARVHGVCISTLQLLPRHSRTCQAHRHRLVARQIKCALRASRCGCFARAHFSGAP